MKQRTALLSTAVAVLALGGAGMTTAQMSQHNQMGQHSDVESPEVVIVDFHADWCGKCEQLGPSLSKAEENLADEPALFVKLDMTNDRTKKQAEYLMAELGMGDIWTEHGTATGFALVLDTQSDQVLSKINFNSSADEIGKTIASAM